jgi:4-hydroxythreonine-4-phosphate dehydrogenase
MGDPSGVGPETIVGAWGDPALHAAARPLVVGHPEIMRRAADLLSSDVRIEEIAAPEDARPHPQRIPVLTGCSDDVLDTKPATVDPRCGQAAYDCLLSATELALAGRVDAITTAPLNKAAMHQAGIEYPGHTEILAELCGVDDYAMMLYLRREDDQTRGLGVVHVTLHMALWDVFSHLSSGAILAKTQLIDRVMTDLNGQRPKVGVCALNPHAGEQGSFGDEEQTMIRPAVLRARDAGIDVTGPLPADTLLARAAEGDFDAVVAMYHDQGHIAIKLLGMHRAVNITLGLPIVRTSVAHGTAFDLAWQGRAKSTGMVEAIGVAARLAVKRSAVVAETA